MLYIAENKNYEKLVDPSIYIPRFANVLLNGTYNKKVLKTARNIIASMKRDWIQTGRKPSGICGAALYTAALAHGIKCSKTDIVGIVHICEATLTKRLNEFVDTEAGSLNVKELKKREKEMQKRPFATNQTSNKETLHCKHQDRKPVNYGLCEECYSDFISDSGGLVGGSDPPAFQRAEKERMEKEKAAREENEGGISSLNHDEQLNSMREPLYSNVSKKAKPCLKKGEGEKDEDDSEVSDESGNFSDVSDTEVDCYINNEEERRYKKVVWEEMNKEYIKEQADKAAALKAANDALNASSSNLPEHARKLVEASKAAVAKSRKEKQQKRAEEEKNAPPPATTTESVRRMLDRKRLRGLIPDDVLDDLFDPSPTEKPAKISRTETVMEKTKEVKSNKQEDGEKEEEDEAEEDEEGYVESYDINTDLPDGEKLYEEEDEEEEEDGYDFGLY